MQHGTFMNVARREDGAAPGAVVIGVPYDAATHPTRVGARLGPAAIRDQSTLIMPFDPATGIDLTERTSLTDVGDAEVVAGDPERSFPAATDLIASVLDDGGLPVVLGGDGLVTLPTLRALGPRNEGLAVVHVDAHTDTYPGPGFSTAHTFTRAAEEGLIDTTRSVHVGVRGTTLSPEAWSHARDVGFTVITTDEWLTAGTAVLVERIADVVGSGPAHLSFDMDVFDPSVAPGVCTPAWGGVDATRGLDLIDRLVALPSIDWVGFDNQTVSPPHDLGGMTALLAGTTVARFLLGLARKA